MRRPPKDCDKLKSPFMVSQPSQGDKGPRVSCRAAWQSKERSLYCFCLADAILAADERGRLAAPNCAWIARSVPLFPTQNQARLQTTHASQPSLTSTKLAIEIMLVGVAATITVNSTQMSIRRQCTPRRLRRVAASSSVRTHLAYVL